MKRFFDIFNLLGVAAMAMLCAAQWSANGRLGRENGRLETTRFAQAAEIEKQAGTIKDQAQDLDEFRNRLTDAEGQLKDVTAALGKMTAERDQMKADLNQWIAAVKARDDLIKQAAVEIQTLAKQRNDAIGQFNDLAKKYNAVVK